MAKKQADTTTTFRAFRVKIRGIQPYSQSRYLVGEGRGKGEDWDAYEQRVWKQKMHVEGGDPENADAHVLIPGSALQQAVAEFAKLRGEKIAGKGMKTWTKHFLTGVRVFGDIKTSAKVKDVYPETNLCDSQGQKGSGGGTRVARTFPCVKQGWTADVTFLVTDDEITREKFSEYLAGAGMQIGLGRWRPQNGGSKGMFCVDGEVEEVDALATMGV